VGTRHDSPALFPNGSTLLPTGQTIRPAGQLVTFHGRPIDLALAPDGKTLYAKDDRGVVVIDAARWTLRQELPFRAGGGSLHGIVVSRDGARVFATNSGNLLCEATVGADGKLTWTRQIALPGPRGEGASFPCGIALAGDGKRAYVALSINNTLAVVDLEAGKLVREIPIGVAPWGVVLTPDGKTAIVSDWGGRLPHAGELTAPSAGTPTLVDRRGIAASGAVSFVDLGQGLEADQVATGLHPSDLKLSPDGRTLYVANANSDTVSVIRVDWHRVVQTFSTNLIGPFGSAPNALAVSPDGRVLYVANGGDNVVCAFKIGKSGRVNPETVVSIPTAWYPGGLAVDQRFLYVADVKGLGSRGPNPTAKGWSVYDYQGVVQRVQRPPEDSKPAGFAYGAVYENSRHDLPPVPVPMRRFETSVFKHIVYIIKENRSYDQVFGDLKRGNGDPSLVMFGRDVTPNHHALAEQFVLLDNFYCNGVLSADGHSWATEGNDTDHLEKAFGGFARSYTFGDDPLTYSSSGFVWDNALDHGLTVRNYGEMDYATPVPSANWLELYRDFQAGSRKYAFKHSIGIARLRAHSSPDYPGWNLNIPDVLRADLFLRDLKQDAQRGDWPSLVILYLPNDHTSGTAPGSPTPRAQVADNDLALGRVVDGISHSPFWPQTCIFVVEDDSQNGLDHVDGHRSPALVISPYTRRGAVISRFYNQTSVLHTMQSILGLQPLNRMDGNSPVMDACFTNRPDLRPYEAVPNTIPLDEMNPALHALHGPALHWARLSAQLPLDGPDEADPDLLNRILRFAAQRSKIQDVNGPSR
jgi:YVTN family beta-propeller protein